MKGSAEAQIPPVTSAFGLAARLQPARRSIDFRPSVRRLCEGSLRSDPRRPSERLRVGRPRLEGLSVREEGCRSGAVRSSSYKRHSAGPETLTRTVGERAERKSRKADNRCDYTGGREKPYYP